MNAHLKILAAAAITVGTTSIGYAQSNTATGSENQVQSAADRAGDTTERAADKTGAALDNAADRTGNAAQNAADKTGNTVDKALSGQGIHGTAQAPDAEGIRDVLASTTEATLKGSFSDIVERFVDADRNRLGEAMPSDDQLKPFNDLKEQFRNDWQAKYNQEFDIEKEELVFDSSVKIYQGEFGETQPDRARTAGERSDASGTDQPSDGQRSILGNTDLQTMPEKKGPKGGIDLTDAAEQDRANRASGSNISGSSNASTDSDSVEIAGVGNQRPSDAGAVGSANRTDRASNTRAGSSNREVVEGDTDADSGLGRAVDRTGDAIGNAADATGDAVTAGVGSARDAVTGNADTNREKGRNMATVMIPASHGLPAINVPLIHELPDSWRIDIPDNVDAAKLQANLQKHLSKAHQQKGQWPADANEAYLTVAHHVLLAIFEGTPHVQQSGSSGAGAQPAAGTVPPGQQPATPAQPQ
ncbi:MAG TPA: hypothetical protein VGR35_04180 [Tepidisphaeraceae bacterium]|nr:hypothetical protein [Tepidisphaeraceae bacterium]